MGLHRMLMPFPKVSVEDLEQRGELLLAAIRDLIHESLRIPRSEPTMGPIFHRISILSTAAAEEFSRLKAEREH